MPLLTAADRREFHKDTKKKIKLSNKFAREFKRWSNKVAAEMVRNRIFDGAISPGLQDELRSILIDHYKKVVNDFAKFDFKSYAAGVYKEESNPVDTTLNRIAAKLSVLILTTGTDMYKAILETTRKNILRAIEVARDSFKIFYSDDIDSGRDFFHPHDVILKQQAPLPGPDQIMSSARRLLLTRLYHRAELIGITETQWAAEATRFFSTDYATQTINNLLADANNDVGNGLIDAAKDKINSAKILEKKSYSRVSKEVIAQASRDVSLENVRKEPRKIIPFKAWITRMDGVVRPTHKAALGQRQRDDEPFNVGDSKLMYPRDLSLGASTLETARCRCWVVYD